MRFPGLLILMIVSATVAAQTLKLDRGEHHFGEISELASVTTRFQATNTGTAELIIEEFGHNIVRVSDADVEDVIKEIEESLEQSLRDILGGNQDVGGPKVVADMLNLTGSSVEKNVLDQMDGQDPEVAESVRNLMFVFDDISKLTDREIQTLMREVDQKDLVVAMKAASEELKEKILLNMSDRFRTFMQEEMDFMGPMRLREVEDVQLRIVQKARQLEDQGQLNIVRGPAEVTFV